MSAYTLIESRDPVEHYGTGKTRTLARQLAEHGNDVTVFLVQSGVGGARRGVLDGELRSLQESGVTVYADEFALQERGIDGSGMNDVVQIRALDTLLDHLADGHKMLWH